MVLIDMEMPKNCHECPIWSSDVCNAIDWQAEKIDFTIRHPNCPLKEANDNSVKTKGEDNGE